MIIELRGEIGSVTIEVLEYENPSAENADDGNWLSCFVTITVGAFTAQYPASFRTDDFPLFLDQLEIAVDKLDGVANFESMERQLEINVKITSSGVGLISGTAKTLDLPGTFLTFAFLSDQSLLKLSCNQMGSVVRSFPVKHS